MGKEDNMGRVACVGIELNADIYSHFYLGNLVDER